MVVTRLKQSSSSSSSSSSRAMCTMCAWYMSAPMKIHSKADETQVLTTSNKRTNRGSQTTNQTDGESASKIKQETGNTKNGRTQHPAVIRALVQSLSCGFESFLQKSFCRTWRYPCEVDLAKVDLSDVITSSFLHLHEIMLNFTHRSQASGQENVLLGHGDPDIWAQATKF